VESRGPAEEAGGFGAAADLKAAGDEVGEVGGDAAGERAVEGVALGWCGGFVDELASCVFDSFADDGDGPTELADGVVEITEEAVRVEGKFGQIDQVRGVIVVELGERCGGGEPTRAAAHGFIDRGGLGERADVHAEVADRLGDVAGGGAVTGAAVGAGDVVVDRLGDADDREVEPPCRCRLGNRVSAAEGAVAADHEEMSDVAVLQMLEDAIEVGIGRFDAGGAEGCAGGSAEFFQIGGRESKEVDEVILQQTFNSEPCAENLLEATAARGFVDDAVKAGVDDGGWAAALEDEEVAGCRGAHGKSAPLPLLPVIWRI